MMEGYKVRCECFGCGKKGFLLAINRLMRCPFCKSLLIHIISTLPIYPENENCH